MQPQNCGRPTRELAGDHPENWRAAHTLARGSVTSNEASAWATTLMAGGQAGRRAGRRVCALSLPSRPPSPFPIPPLFPLPLSHCILFVFFRLVFLVLFSLCDSFVCCLLGWHLCLS